MARSQTSRLIADVTAARIFDLSQPFTADMPQLPGAPRFQLGLLRRHGDAQRAGGYSAANELLITIGHAGTHIDALGHVSVDGRLHGGLSAEATQRGTGGLRQLGIETVEPIIRRTILLDVAGFLGVAALEPAFGVGGDLLQACLERTGSTIEAGDVVLVRTGWGAYWQDASKYVSQQAGLPGVDDDGARWLAEQRIFGTGADCLMYERYDPAEDRLPVHCRLIEAEGIHLIENMNLEMVAKAGVTECALVVLPLRLVGATASQVRPIALT